jgi:outer membrane protein assembly factor BamE (lipoprotein component of BamABCDE complex)
MMAADRAGERRLRPAAPRLVLSLALVLAGAACGPQIRTHGYVPPEDALAAISVGLDTRETVADTVGTPTASGVLGETGYYYVLQRIQQRGYREPRVVEREIVAISFDEAGVVRNIERFGLEDGNVVALSRRVTDSNVEGIGFLRQLMGNLGRINPGALAGEP